MLPLWADILIVAALPFILGLVLFLWGAEEPDNSIAHEQEDAPRGGDDPDVMTAVA